MLTSTLSETAAADAIPRSVIDRLLSAGRVFIVVSFFTISPLALVAMDWQYTETGGWFADKFHPATLLAFALIALPLFVSRNPLSAALSFANRNLDLAPFVLAIFFSLLYAGQVMGHSITIFIETFLGAVAMLVLFSGLDDRSRRTLARILHVLLFANALLAFYEIVSAFRLTPLVVNGELLADEPRATALLGHPLANALLAGAYVVVLAIGGTRDIPSPLRTPVFLVALASLVPFGGRAATATCLVTLAVAIASRAVRIVRGGNIRTMRLLSVLWILPTAMFVLVTAHEIGWLDTLLDRLIDDEGSASTRIVMFELFDHFSFSELLVGPDQRLLDTWATIYGLDYGIESFLVAFVLHYGLIATVVFVPCLIHFLYLVVEATGTRTTWYVVTYFVIVAMTSLSLSSKSPILSMFVVMVLLLLSGSGRKA